MAFLELNRVGKSYGDTCVLRDVNLHLERGEFVAIVGFSGAGKTTLINLIAGLLRPDHGSITLNGLEITSPGPDRGVVFQNYSLLPWLTVFQNILLAVEQCFPNWPPARQTAHVDHQISLVHLTHARNQRPHELSGGMKQRVSLARALAMDPQILLLDEPLSALDALTRANLQDEIARLREATRKTIVLITNDPDEGIYLADRILPLTAGPEATLGPAIDVSLPHPRDRKALNHLDQFKQLRRDVIAFLLKSRKPRGVELTRKLVLPEIEPEDLSQPRSFTGRRRPVRKSEIHRETVEVEP